MLEEFEDKTDHNSKGIVFNQEQIRNQVINQALESFTNNKTKTENIEISNIDSVDPVIRDFEDNTNHNSKGIISNPEEIRAQAINQALESFIPPVIVEEKLAIIETTVPDSFFGKLKIEVDQEKIQLNRQAVIDQAINDYNNI